MTYSLVVDDVRVTRMVSEKILNDLGIETRSVANLTDAHAALNDRFPDVILLDWHVGKESGIDFLKQIRAEGKTAVPVIVYSAVETENAAAEAVSAGANLFITKPTTFEKIEQALVSVGIKV